VSRRRNLPAVQRLFSMFPRGTPGLALILLRASVATALIADACCHRQSVSLVLQGAAIVAALAVSAGFLTPLGGVLALAVHGMIWSSAGVGNAAFAILASVDALALALVGPGAYSVDAYRYGRRVVVLPPR
jgi:hypothetical protein